MKFGVHLIQQNIEMAELRRLWTWADTAGFDWIDASDHFYEAPLVHENHGDYWEGTTIMTALACETKNLRIGSLVLGMNYRHPAVLANALAAMDHLSGGRIELGIGAGWYEDEYRAYGIPFPSLGKRLDILEEGIQVIRLLLTKDHVNFEGEHFTLADACCNPKPLQDRLRIWGGGVGRKRTLPMIARLCDGWNGPYLTPWQFRHLSRVLREACDRENRDFNEIEKSVNLSFHLAASEAARPRAEEHARTVFGGAIDTWRERGLIMGTPDEAKELVAEYQDLGCDLLNIAIRPPLDWEALEAWAREVIPAFSED